ncbi:hypothetical protein MPQ_1073 [Methylovorus sp. MP688]|nr:hypothetical protein MPQ_1073 [Methylovorus sp. MP688]
MSVNGGVASVHLRFQLAKRQARCGCDSVTLSGKSLRQ